MNQEIIKKEIKELELSFSAIDTFNLCPRKYYYSYVLKLPKKDWPWLVFGTFTHLCLEKFHKYILYFKKRNMQINFSELMKRAYLSSSRVYQRKSKLNPGLILSEQQKTQIKDILKEHLDKVKQNYPNVLYVEKGFRLKVGEFIIRGYIDRIDKIAENIYKVLDYKTSSKAYDTDKNNQLGIYAYALTRLLGEHIHIKKQLDFIKLGKEKFGVYDPDEKDRVEKFIIDAGTRIKNSIDNMKTEDEWKPKDNEFCKFCDFKERCYASRDIIL